MFILDISLAGPTLLLDIPSFESNDPVYSKSLLRLKRHLSICIRALRLLLEWGPRFEQRGYPDFYSIPPQVIANELLVLSYGNAILDLFTDSKNRTQIMSSENLAKRILSLILQVPWLCWTPIGVTTDELAYLQEFDWGQLRNEWKGWEQAIRVLDSEAKRRLHKQRFGEVQAIDYKREAFTDAGVKFVERDEHFWWADPKPRGNTVSLRGDDSDATFVEDGSEIASTASTLSEHKPVSDGSTKASVERTKVKRLPSSPMRSRTNVEADRPADWRGEHFVWSPGGDCCA
jgi:hypothetical protein